MKYTPLGRSGLKVSRLCLGTMNFGPHTNEGDSFAIMDRALVAGVNFFDTADIYGWKKGEGITEKIVGRWLGQGGGRRERIVLATKVFAAMHRDDQYDPNWDRGLSARKIILGCENSLRRMQVDYIDLFQMHHIDRRCPFDEIWQAYETLVAQGKILYAGSSNFAGWDVATASLTARGRKFLGLVSEQSLYNLTERTLELEVLPACR
ncbi:MAG TPA: aldo/keto reductase, partial [Opitutales bacterium]|nr:aldo/keto reductase [Opitutales bacterium]